MLHFDSHEKTSVRAYGELCAVKQNHKESNDVAGFRVGSKIGIIIIIIILFF